MPIIRTWPLLAILTLSAALLASPVPAAAADGPWQKIYDRAAPQATAIEMFDDQYGLAVIGYGVQRSIDGGVTWSEPDPAAGVGGGHIAIADRQHAWIAGYSGVILRTDDGGLTWHRQATGTEAHFNGIAAVSATEAWATAYGAGFSDVGPFAHEDSVLLHTVDAGATWSPVRMSDYGVFLGLWNAGADLWLLASPCRPGDPFGPGMPDGRPPCSDRNTLLHSADGGRTWDVLAQEPAPVPTQLSRIDAQRAFGISRACGASFCVDQVVATADGGRTWQARSFPATTDRVYVSVLRFTGPDDGWATLSECAAECRYGLAHTADGARTWQLVDMPAPGAPSFALAVTSTHVVAAVGTTGVQRYAIATGAWQAATTDARPSLGSIAFISRDHGYAIADGALWATDDGGATWRPGPPSPPLAGVTVTPGGAFWAAAWDGRVFRSDDAGATWRVVEAAPGPLFAGLQAFDGQRAWLTLNDGLWRTDDGGATWRHIDAASYPRYEFADRDHGWTTSCERSYCAGSIRVTDDGGATWVTRAVPDHAYVQGFVDGLRGWASLADVNVVADGVGCPCVLRTTDGARSWQAVSTAPWSLSSMTFLDARRGWAVGYDYSVRSAPYPMPSLLATTDGGRTWTKELILPGYLGGQMVAAHGRVWLPLGVGASPWIGGRLLLYRRDVVPLPRLIAPDTGAGPGGAAAAPLRAIAALAVGGVLLAITGLAWRRRRLS
ncbi:MAG TPA: hypothetical protein VEZ14_14620 [Dehalococcoidia bacterium]|nr:hypothetical protein [Dehalococcoidia bacterium]